ncbi:chorismate mutase [Aquihabitans sp. G128]|uniref:chorismate mutase n=1 Tax=Aquihabitans sp. G128 TaxID=2849779 RepID=UPI001C244BEE|nr:chorismate mutase [Aquihabitans sp. G128]QXC62015.1 chorismate mutase [Aquihabitans sp. G128]
MPAAVRALRGATTVDADTPEQIAERTVALLEAMFERNGVDHDDLISIWFTVTEDLTSAFPATGARAIGLGDVPLLCAREIPVPGSMPRCVRVLAHLTTDRPRSELHHVYLEGAVTLRDDLPS